MITYILSSFQLRLIECLDLDSGLNEINAQY